MKTGVPGSSGGKDRCVKHAPPASLHFIGEGTGNQWSHSANSERAESRFLSLFRQLSHCQHSIQTSVGVSALFVGLLCDRSCGFWLADA